MLSIPSPHNADPGNPMVPIPGPRGANPGILQCHSQNPALPTPEPRGANSGVLRRRSRWDPRHSRLTCEQEGDQAGFLGQEELEAGAAEHVFHHGLGAAGALQERQELLRLLCVLRKNGNSETPPWNSQTPRNPDLPGLGDPCPLCQLGCEIWAWR